jgi:phage terminase large subunit-like protein
MTLMASLVLDTGQRWGDAAQRWQLEDAKAILEPAPGEPLMYFMTRARGASKDTDLAGVSIGWLLCQTRPHDRAYVFAVDEGQAKGFIDAVAGLVARSGLAGAVKVDGAKATSLSSGASVSVMSSDAPSAYGLRGSLYVVNELTLWPLSSRGLWTAIVSGVPKVAGCRLVCLGSAGDPAHFSYRIRERARLSPRWRLHEVPGPVPWVSADALEEQRLLLTDSQYDRLHLNRWTASEDRLVSAENLDAAVVLAGPQEPRPGIRYAVGCDIGLRNDRTAVCVCHCEPVKDRVPPARRVVLDRLIVFAGTRQHEVRLADVEVALLDVWRRYNRPKVRLDPWQAIGLAQQLKARGVVVEEYSFTPQRYGQAAQTLFTLLRDGLLALYPDEALLDELRNVRLKETQPGLLRVDHDPGRHDDMAVALGFAATALVEKLELPASIVAPPRGHVPRTNPTARDARQKVRYLDGTSRPVPRRGWAGPPIGPDKLRRGRR